MILHENARLRPKDLVPGLRFGRLVTFREDGRLGGSVAWICQCDCGTSHRTRGYQLTGGMIFSCGCLRREKASTHGMSRTPEYAAWIGIRNRCYNPNIDSYPNYGGRGISVCERWINSFENFYSDMGPRPSEGHSIDRMDANGNYEPSNCRWATLTEQNRNLRRNHRITVGGVTLCVAAWAERTGISAGTIHRRMRYGWCPTKCVLLPTLSPKMKSISATKANNSRWKKLRNRE
jgi:hypothetical protein